MQIICFFRLNATQPGRKRHARVPDVVRVRVKSLPRIMFVESAFKIGAAADIIFLGFLAEEDVNDKHVC
jgi:hypothetical protein